VHHTDSEDNAMKNVGREFATMDEDERHRFALERAQENAEKVHELDLFDDPRDPDHMGRHVMPKDPLRAEEDLNEMAESGALPEGVTEERRRQPRDGKGR
jgi:hypothetical protein